MGDKAYQRAMLKMRAGIIATRGVLKQDRMNEFGITSDVVGGIYGNLATNTSRVGSQMTAQHARQMAALANLADRTQRGTARDAARGERGVRTMFGSAISGGMGEAYRANSTKVKAGLQELKGELRSGKVTAAGGQTILGILQSGVAEAQAGAQAQTADALAYRAREDAKLIADRQNMLLQSKLDFQTWRRQQDYLHNLEQKDATKSLGGVTQVAELGTTASVDMYSYLRDNPDATVDQLVTAAANGDSSLLADPAKVEFLASIARRVKADAGPDGLAGQHGYDESAQDILNAILQMYPNYKGARDVLLKNIEAGLRAGWNARTIEAGIVGNSDGSTDTTTTHTAGGSRGSPGYTRTVTDTQHTPSAAELAVGNAYASPDDAPPGTTGHWETRGLGRAGASHRVWVVDGVA